MMGWHEVHVTHPKVSGRRWESATAKSTLCLGGEIFRVYLKLGKFCIYLRAR